MKKLSRMLPALGKRKELVIVVTAAFLLELLSAAQYYFTHRLMEEELEKRAESELTMKTEQIKSTMHSAEKVMLSNMWDITRNTQHPDSLHQVLSRIMQSNHHIKGCGFCARPDLYPEKGRLFEVYSSLDDNHQVFTRQVVSEKHDYTTYDLYKQAVRDTMPIWSEPYIDNDAAQDIITSHVVPLFTDSLEFVGLAVSDISLSWLKDTIDRRHLYPSSFVLLFTPLGNAVIQPSEDSATKEMTQRIISIINDSTMASEKSLTGLSRIVHYNVGGRRATIFHATMDVYPYWQVAEVCYDDEIYASLSWLRIRHLLMMVVAFAILLYVIRRFARGEKKLNDKMMEQQRIDRELKIASGIQKAMLQPQQMKPDTRQQLPADLYVSLTPAREVGGDFYDYYLRDERLFFCVGDVTGKGIPAALLMAVVRPMFRSETRRSDSAVAIVDAMNRNLSEEYTAGFFVTMFVGILDLATGHLDYCNAGHEAPMLSGKVLPVKPNLPVGALDDWVYEGQSATFDDGDMLFVYTDGLSEAMNSKGIQFTRQRVNHLAAEHSNGTARQLIEMMEHEVHSFTDGAPQNDDITLLAIKWQRKEPSVSHLSIKSTMDEIGALEPFVSDAALHAALSSIEAKRLRLAVEEAVANIINHGQATAITLSAANGDGQLTLTITDDGQPFDPTADSKTDLSVPPDQRPPGGLGIMFLHQMTDGLDYCRDDGHNILTIRKNIS